ncbi:MAG: hypothetical protein LBE11_07115 [Prevotellaceae bacterium]|jgi:hypothetical protein|nr:hypothetical protein [Prevotellaceae bacterium]
MELKSNTKRAKNAILLTWILLVAEMATCIMEIVLAVITVKIIKDYSIIEPLLYKITDENENL